METAAERRARLKALREEAAGAGALPDAAAPAAAAAADASADAAAEPPAPRGDEPVLRFRNYQVRDADAIAHTQVPAARVPELAAAAPAPAPADPAAAGEALAGVAPRKPDWDLRRDVAPKLARLERRTQAAIVKLMMEAEQRRLAEEGGAQD